MNNQQEPSVEQKHMRVAFSLLMRVDLKGGEVDDAHGAFSLINGILSGELIVVPTDMFMDGQRAVNAALENDKGKKKIVDPFSPEILNNDSLPVLKDDTSNGDDMISQGGPVVEKV